MSYDEQASAPTILEEAMQAPAEINERRLAAGVVVREATAEDAESCARIFYDAFESIAARHDFPVEPPQILASIYHGMGINLDTTMMPGPGNRPIRLVDAEPIRQLF